MCLAITLDSSHLLIPHPFLYNESQNEFDRTEG